MCAADEMGMANLNQTTSNQICYSRIERRFIWHVFFNRNDTATHPAIQLCQAVMRQPMTRESLIHRPCIRLRWRPAILLVCPQSDRRYPGIDTVVNRSNKATHQKLWMVILAQRQRSRSVTSCELVSTKAGAFVVSTGSCLHSTELRNRMVIEMRRTDESQSM